jgi:hypothetical protein
MTSSENGTSNELSMDEIHARMIELRPKPEDFHFVHPAGWSQNLCAGSTIISVLPDSAKHGSEALIDGDGYKSWVAPLTGTVPEAVIDLGHSLLFDRIVVFARHTDNRGTGGGNNSVRRLGVAVSESSVGPWQEVETGEVEGPSPMCFKTAGGQVCTYIDRAEPTVFEITPVQGRFVQVRLLEAHWEADVPDDWKSSVAISEFMLFKSKSD